MKIYLPIAKIDAVNRMVWGYASTESRDNQDEIVKREALDAALGDYMKFANIREMHQLSAVGKAKEAAVDEKGLYVGAKVVDDQAWEKVVERVYSGFSIGGKVTSRDPADYKTITGLRLDEISLVDRPANPEAVFDCWKRSTTADHRGKSGDLDDSIAELRAAIERVEAMVRKADSEAGYADPGYRPDKKKRYPIDTQEHIRAAWNFIHKPKNAGKYSPEELKRIKAKIVAAWREQIDPTGPPSADDEAKATRVELNKHLADVGFVAQVVLSLDRLKEMLAIEAAVEGDDSPQSERLASIVAELCGFLNALVAEETAEIESGAEARDESDRIAMAAIASSLAKSGLAGRAKAFEERFVLARPRKGDHLLLDAAHNCIVTLGDAKTCTAAEARAPDETVEGPARAEDEDQGPTNEVSRAVSSANLQKALAEEKARGDALAKSVAELTPRLDAIARTVEEIARTPIPPLTSSIAGLREIEKGRDGASSAAMTDGEVAAAIARMSPEEQTMMLIKASRLRPIRIAGLPGTAEGGNG